MSGAMKQEDCDTCRHASGGPRSGCPRQWEHIACSQAETMEERAVEIRKLIRERDHEKSQAEAAYDLAEQYARRAGVDVTRDDTLKYVEQYWEQRGKFERDWKALESLRWEVFQLDFDLAAGLSGGGVDEHTGRQVAENVRLWIRACRELGGNGKRSVDMYSRPIARSAEQVPLFGGAA